MAQRNLYSVSFWTVNLPVYLILYNLTSFVYILFYIYMCGSGSNISLYKNNVYVHLKRITCGKRSARTAAVAAEVRPPPTTRIRLEDILAASVEAPLKLGALTRATGTTRWVKRTDVQDSLLFTGQTKITYLGYSLPGTWLPVPYGPCLIQQTLFLPGAEWYSVLFYISSILQVLK